MDWKKLLFSFSGRINRAKYWLTMLIYFAVGIVLGLIQLIMGRGISFQILSAIVELVVFVSTLAVLVKRLHDRDRSAWWLALFYIAPGVLVIAAITLAYTDNAMFGRASDGAAFLFRILMVAAFAIGTWAFVEFSCLRGTKGYNRFGPDPLSRT